MSASEQRLKCLLIAETANPEGVSVPLEGWSLARALRDRVDGHLVTQVRHRDAIVRAGLVEGQDFTAIDSEGVARKIWSVRRLVRGDRRKGWTTAMAFSALAYYEFERLLWKQFGERIRAGEFDIVHRITPLSPTVPSIIAGRCRRAGVPFVIGPLNGGVPWPKWFDKERRQEREWLSYVRGAYKLMPGYRSTRRNAAAIIAGSRDTLNQISARYRGKCRYIPENGVDPERFTSVRTRSAAAPLRAIFVGRLVPYKGADMLIEAAAPLIRERQLVLTIVGDGPELPRLQEIAAREAVSEGVSFTGRIPHHEVQAKLVENDVFAFPSIREFGGAVALEAMAVGLPPIVVAYGGLAELVTPETGFLLEIGPRASIVEQLRETLGRIVRSPEILETRAAAAHDRVHSLFTWQAKAGQVLAVYQRVLGRTDRDPAPAGPEAEPRGAAVLAT